MKFVGGLHIDRMRNVKELITKYKGDFNQNYDKEGISIEKEGDIPLEFHMSKVPMKFTSFPLTLILDLHLHTPLKLNLHRAHTALLDPEDLPQPEWHHLRFEGLVSSHFTNSVTDIVRMRNLYRKQAQIISEGREMPEVEEWTITNVDNRIEFVNS